MPKKTLEKAHANNNTIILHIKKNQPNLRKEVITAAISNPHLDENFTHEVSRGRVENRNLKTYKFSSNQWPEVKVIARLFRHTIRKINNKTVESRNVSYFLCNQELPAHDLNTIIRNHWCIENSNHNIRDNALLEDDNRIKIKPENMTIIRSFGYNIIQAGKKGKAFVTQMEINKLDFDKLLNSRGILRE